MSDDIAAAACEVFQHFRHGLATGEWSAWFDCLAQDVSVSFPMGRFKGTHVGRDKAEAFFNFVSQTFPEGLRLELLGVTSNQTTAVFEFKDWGRLGGQPYENRVALALDLEDGRVTAYREYFGLLSA